MAKFWSVNWIGSWGLWSLGRWRDERERKGGAGGERGRGRGRGVGGGGCGGVGDGRGRGNQHFQYQQHHQQYPQFYHQEQQGQFRNPWKGDQLAQGPNSGHGGATAADGSSSSSRLSKETNYKWSTPIVFMISMVSLTKTLLQGRRKQDKQHH